jgi:hypothetical protein
MRLHRVIPAAAIVAAVLAFAAPASVAQDSEPEPTLEANLDGASFGEQVIVSGAFWPENSIVQVEICGNLGLNGTSDCDQTTAFQSGVSIRGTFGAVMLVGNPPVPCPCVYRATSITSGLVKTLEFELRGAAVGEPSVVPLPDRRLDIIDAHMEGSGPWTALFGARPDRTLVFTVVNTGFVAVDDPSIVLGVGKDANPTGFVAPPRIDRLEPGESITLRVDVDLPVFAIGTYAVEGSIPGFETPVAFRAESSHIPWLLFLIPVLILAQLGLLAIRNRIRGRVYEVQTPSVAAEALPVDSETVEDLVEIDLRDEELIDVDAEWGDPVETPAEADAESDAKAAELEAIIDEELGTVFDEAARHRDVSIDNSAFRELVIDLAHTASERVAERAALDKEGVEALDAQIGDAVLTAFGVEQGPPT